jgi:hypothetical protein
MRRGRHIVARVLFSALVLAVAAGCERLPKTPTPTATPIVDVPTPVLAAREAALAYLRQAYPQSAPSEGIAWAGRNAAPGGPVGSASYKFSSGDWLMTIGVPMVSPELVLYEIELVNSGAAFRWTGRLDRGFSVLESNLGVAVEALVARDVALQYVREHHADRAPPQGAAWAGECTGQPGVVGHESCRFVAADWTMKLDYDVLPPDQMLYSVELGNSVTTFAWRGQVDAQGEVMEYRLE